MKKQTLIFIALLFGLLLTTQTAAAAPPGTAFAYQGRLNEGANPANGSYVFRFTVYDQSGNGNTVGGPITTLPLDVSNGLFTVSLDFGAGVFNGANRWLGIEVHTNEMNVLFVPLTPLQSILPTPYAIYAEGVDAANVNGILPIGSLSGIYSNAMILTNANNVFAGNGAGLTNVNAATLGGLSASNFWQLGGNAGTTSAHFLGTTDSQPLELRVGNDPVLRLVVSAGTPHIVGGSYWNSALAGARGGTIGGGGGFVLVGGGGSEIQANTVTDDYGTVGGGAFNQAGDNSGGFAGAAFASVGGGFKNVAASYSATIAGGQSNNAGGSYAAIPGGSANSAMGNYSLAAGRRAKAVHMGSFVWADSQDSDFSSTGNNQFCVRASGGLRLDGDIWTGSHDLRLRTFGDINHGIGYRETIGANYIDGPFIYGYNGGALGTSSPETVAVTWNWLGDVACARDLSCGRDFACGGNARVGHNLSTDTLTIRGGADLAEPFEMCCKEIPPGAVVVIDEEHPGQLKLSNRAYDTCVAGVVSGANGIKPGISLHQEGVLMGGQNVALTGRVYVKTDALYGAIKPGDLLTTSETPGHAMKAKDAGKAQGAILGKAMGSLREGRGVVLVLVTLQ